MSRYLCISSGPLDESVHAPLADGLVAITAERFGQAAGPVTVEFSELDPDRWFTAAERSDTTLVLGAVPAGTPQETRADHMGEVARFVAEITGKDLDHVMVVAADAKEN